jgi:hypothetical protein
MADVRVESVRVGDFYATFLRGNKDDLHKWHSQGFIARPDLAMRKVVVRGELEMIERPADSPAWPIERAGSDSQYLPDIYPGNYVVRCNADDTFWIIACAMTEPNPAPFMSEVFNVPAGGTISVRQGAILVVGCGVLEAGERVVRGPSQVYARTKSVDFTVREPVIAVSAWR